LSSFRLILGVVKVFRYGTGVGSAYVTAGDVNEFVHAVSAVGESVGVVALK
jgi:hypothetical protein